MIPVPAALIRPLIYLSVAGGLFCAGWWIGKDGAQDKAREATLLANAKAEEVRRATEDAWQVAHWKLAYAAEEQRIEREQKFKADLAGLDDGTVRVRDRFVCPKAPAGPAASSQSEPAEESGLLQSDVRFLLSIAAEADTIADERNQCIASYNALRNKP